jgi:hypothetical protein
LENELRKKKNGVSVISKSRKQGGRQGGDNWLQNICLIRNTEFAKLPELAAQSAEFILRKHISLWGGPSFTVFQE